MQISVVIPLFNKEKTIRRAIHSILAQTVPPTEIIVVNDGSTDNSAGIVSAIESPLLKMVHQTNGGVSTARNIGIALANSPWIAFLDADDFWALDYLYTIQGLHATFPEAKVLATSYDIQLSQGLISINLNKLPFSGQEGRLSNYFEVAACSHPPVWTSAVVVLKQSLQQIKGFPEGIAMGEDLLTWSRLACKNTIAYHRAPKAVYNRTEALNPIKSNRVLIDRDNDVGRELEKLLRLYPQKRHLRKYIAHWYAMRTNLLFQNKLKAKALGSICSGLKFNPWNYKLYAFLVFIVMPASWAHYFLKNRSSSNNSSIGK
jgi:glycosyltransferase involved in cell wall biosynthesis